MENIWCKCDPRSVMYHRQSRGLEPEPLKAVVKTPGHLKAATGAVAIKKGAEPLMAHRHNGVKNKAYRKGRKVTQRRSES